MPSLRLTEGARQAARLSLRLAGLGFPAAWAPPAAKRKPLRLKREEGDPPYAERFAAQPP